MLQSLSDELLKLKSATKHYEETKETLQNMCETMDKISATHQKLTDNIGQFMVELGKMDLEGKKTRELIQSTSDEVKRSFETEVRRHEAAVEASLSKNHSEISNEIGKQTDKILQQNENQSKALRLVKYLVALGVLIEAAAVIGIFLL